MSEVRELPKKIKYLTALNIFYGNVAFGAALNAFGPALTTLQNKYGVDDSQISTTFSILTGCTMVGTLVGGAFIFDRVNRQLAVIVAILIKSLSLFITPHCSSLTTYFLSVGLLGLASGAYDSAQFVWMLEMMQKDCPPYVQTQHFSYAVGTIVGPLVIAPFLEDDGLQSAKEKGDKLIAPFSIIAAIVALNAVFQIVLFTFFRYFKPPPEQPSLKEGEEEMSKGKQGPILFGVQFWTWPKFRFILLCCMFYGAYQGMEMTTFQFFPKFGQNSALNLSEPDAAYVFSGMTGAFAAGRGASIFLAFKIQPQITLVVNIILIIIANILLITWAKGSIVGLWTTGIIFGLGFSSAFGSFAAFIERYLNITNFIGSLILIFASAVAAIYPLIVGNFIENNPIVLGYVVFCSILFIVIAVGTLSYLTFKNKTRY